MASRNPLQVRNDGTHFSSCQPAHHKIPLGSFRQFSSSPRFSFVAGLSSVRHVASRVIKCNAQTSRRVGGKVGANPCSARCRIGGGAPSTGPDVELDVQVVIKAQALQTQPPPLQSIENVTTVGTTAKANKDDLEMSKVRSLVSSTAGRVLTPQHTNHSCVH